MKERTGIIKKLLGHFVKVNGVLGIGSVLLSIVVLILGEVIPKEYGWRYPVIIASIAIIWLAMVILNYIVSISRKVPLKIDVHKIYETLLENIQIEKIIENGVTLSEEKLLCLTMLNNLNSAKKYCFDQQKDLVVEQIIAQVDFLVKRCNILDEVNKAKVENLKMLLTPYA